jgi:toxin ParE1/3/4
MKILILRRAFRDLDAIHNFIALDNPAAADLLIKTALDTIDSLSAQPFSGPEVRFEPAERYRGLRYRLVAGYENYLIFYQVERQTVRVLRVLHGARNVIRIFRPADPD